MDALHHFGSIKSRWNEIFRLWCIDDAFVDIQSRHWSAPSWKHSCIGSDHLQTLWLISLWYRRWTKYSNAGRLYSPTPTPTKFQCCVLLPRVETGGQKKSNPPVWHLTLTLFNIDIGGRGCHAHLFLRVWIFCPPMVCRYVFRSADFVGSFEMPIRSPAQIW